VRETLGLKMLGTTMPGCFWLGEFDIAWRRSPDTMYEWWHEDGSAGAIYIDFTQKWHVHVQFHADQGTEPEAARMEAVFRERVGDHNVRLSNPVWIGKLTINQRMPERFMLGRALLAGDAAHVHTGAGGQGMNTGIQDALNLGWKLALTVSGAAAPSLLASYEAERLANARNLLRTSETYHHIEIPHGVLGRWIGGAVFKGIQSIKPLGAIALARVGMLDLNYARGPLSRQDAAEATSRTRAGWHVPDVSCRIDGQATRLFEILRGTKAHLLLFAGTTPSTETLRALSSLAASVTPYQQHVRVHVVLASESDLPAGGIPGGDVITDGTARMREAFGLHAPEIIYIRPDGYIGLRSNDLGKEKLLDYFGLIYDDAGRHRPQSPWTSVANP
jgi:hypothetical protein